MGAYIQANTDGLLHPADQPSLAPINRGFLYGDAIYEVWRTYGGVLFAFEEHWDRLSRSAAALFLDLPWSAKEMMGELARTAHAFAAAVGRPAEFYVRLQVTRGGGPIGLDTALADKPTFVILVQALGELSPEKLRSGLKLSLATGLRRNSAQSLNPAWKTGNYLNNILCLREARSRGADEVLMVNHGGELTEAAVSNVFFARGDTLFTPPLTAGILEGITRRLLLSTVAAEAGLKAEECVIRPAEMAGFDECFLSSTTRDVCPVAAVDDLQFQVGDHSAAARLKRAFAEHAVAYGQANPQWRLWGGQ